MKKICIFLFGAFLLFSMAACSTDTTPAPPTEPPTATQSPAPTPEPSPEPEPQENFEIHGLLTRIVYGENVAYLFGTMHLGRPEWFPLVPAVEDALSRADVLVLETDLSEEANFEHMETFLEMMAISDGRTLGDLLPQAVYEQFAQRLDSYGISTLFVDNFTPWTISMLVTEFAYDAAGIFSDYGLETYFMDFAAANDIPTIGLNPILHEMELGFNLPDEVQIYAALALTDFDEAVAQTLILADAYARQDIDLLLYLLRYADLEDNPFTQYMVDVLIIQRSIEFAQELIRLLAETEEPTTFFVAVGIGHMVGNDHGNMLEYLSDAGFVLEPLW